VKVNAMAMVGITTRANGITNVRIDLRFFILTPFTFTSSEKGPTAFADDHVAKYEPPAASPML